jgi:hypothetical protein
MAASRKIKIADDLRARRKRLFLFALKGCAVDRASASVRRDHIFLTRDIGLEGGMPQRNTRHPRT